MKPLKFRSFLLAMMLCALCCVPAHALEFQAVPPEAACPLTSRLANCRMH